MEIFHHGLQKFHINDNCKVRNRAARLIDVNLYTADVPRLPPLMTAEDHETDEPDDEERNDERDSSTEPKRHRRVAEPRVTDPYATEDSSSMLVPVAIAIGIFIPLVFCLCKL